MIIDRLPMMHKENYTGPKMKTGAISFAWFVFHPEPHDIEHGIVLKRMLWNQ